MNIPTDSAASSSSRRTAGGVAPTASCGARRCGGARTAATRYHGDMGHWQRVRAADHHECGHAPCDWCGQMLLRRKDGTPRQHPHNKCPGKTAGHKIEREFVKNIDIREFA